MALKFNISSLDSPEAADEVKEVILSAEPDTQVDVDLDAKTLTLDGAASEESFKQILEAAGYHIGS